MVRIVLGVRTFLLGTVLDDTSLHRNRDREGLIDRCCAGRKSFDETNQVFDVLRDRQSILDFCNISEYVRNRRAGRKRKVAKTFDHNI